MSDSYLSDIHFVAFAKFFNVNRVDINIKPFATFIKVEVSDITSAVVAKFFKGVSNLAK